jgi:hypothetical protein
MFTLAFWKAAGERAIKSAAQFVILAYFGGDVIFNVFQADFINMGGVAAGAVLLSVLTSLASAGMTDGSPSLTHVEVLEANGKHEAV